MWYTIIKSRLHMKRSVLVGSKQKICTVDDRSGEIAGSCRRGNVAGVIVCNVGISYCYNSPNGNTPNHRVKTSQITEQNSAKSPKSIDKMKICGYTVIIQDG